MPTEFSHHWLEHRGYRAAQIRSAESRSWAGAAAEQLLNRAAAAVAAQCISSLQQLTGGSYGKQVVVLVGPGKNGADALLAGVLLAARGVQVSALNFGRPQPGPARAFAKVGQSMAALESAPEVRSRLAAADIVVDGIVGLGARPGLGPTINWIIPELRHKFVLAVDLPSGLDPDRGALPDSYLPADLTVTLGAVKPCLLLPPAALAAGRIVLAPLGLDRDHLGAPVVSQGTASDIARSWPWADRQGHKYTRGVLGVIAGSLKYPGAAVLAIGGALATGIGLVRFHGSSGLSETVLRAAPEVVPERAGAPGQCQAWLVGPGIDLQDEDCLSAAVAALRSGLACLIDAGGLALLREQPATGPVLATPHAGELAALLSTDTTVITRAEVERQPDRYARMAAEQLQAVILVKGPISVIAEPGGGLVVQPSGPPQLATAGSGDVLAGIAGALLAQGLAPVDAGAAAVWVHGHAAERANPGGPIRAGDLLRTIGPTIAKLGAHFPI